MKALTFFFASKRALHFFEGACLNFATAASAVEVSQTKPSGLTWAILVIGSIGMGFKSVVSLNSDTDPILPTSGTLEAKTAVKTNSEGVISQTTETEKTAT